MITGCTRPKPHSSGISTANPRSSVNQGLQGFLEEQQINVLLFIINLLVQMMMFKTLKQAQVPKEPSVAIRAAKPIKATGQASEIKTSGFDFLGISLCRGRETAHLKTAF